VYAALRVTYALGAFFLCPLYAPQSTAEILSDLGYDAEHFHLAVAYGAGSVSQPY
jgi:hypothetical protein